MLVNNNRCYYKWMACAQVVLVCLLLLNLSVFAYDAWQPDNDSVAIQGLDKILEEFEILLEKAKASQAAHPVFLTVILCVLSVPLLVSLRVNIRYAMQWGDRHY